MIAFGVGVWQSAGPRRSLRLVSGLLIAYALITLTVGPFSSMHRREVLAAGGATLSDTLHLVVTGFGVLTFLLEIGFAATAFGTWFRFYSIATIAAMLVFGAITSFYAPEVQANEPTPWVGIYERINAYGYMLWIVVLAVMLWKKLLAADKFPNDEVQPRPTPTRPVQIGVSWIVRPTLRTCRDIVQSRGGENVSLIVRALTQRSRFIFEPALSLVPDARAPPNGCWPTTAPVGLSLM